MAQTLRDDLRIHTTHEKQFATEFRETELYILNHTVSELIAAKDSFRKVFNHLVDSASDGAYFLIIDRNQQKVFAIVEELLSRSDLETFGPVKEQTNMDWDERTSDLGEWSLLMNRPPKLTWNVFYFLARKPE